MSSDSDSDSDSSYGGGGYSGGGYSGGGYSGGGYSGGGYSGGGYSGGGYSSGWGYSGGGSSYYGGGRSGGRAASSDSDSEPDTRAGHASQNTQGGTGRGLGGATSTSARDNASANDREEETSHNTTTSNPSPGEDLRNGQDSSRDTQQNTSQDRQGTESTAPNDDGGQGEGLLHDDLGGYPAGRSLESSHHDEDDGLNHLELGNTDRGEHSQTHSTKSAAASEDESSVIGQEAHDDATSVASSDAPDEDFHSDSDNERDTKGNGSNSRTSSGNRRDNDPLGDAEAGFHDIDAMLPDNSEAGGVGIYVRLDSTESDSGGFFNAIVLPHRQQADIIPPGQGAQQQPNNADVARTNENPRTHNQPGVSHADGTDSLRLNANLYPPVASEDLEYLDPESDTDVRISSSQNLERMKYIKALEQRVIRDASQIFSSTGYGTIRNNNHSNFGIEDDDEFWACFCPNLPFKLSQGPNYTGLPGKSHIRVLVIEPGNKDEVVSCAMDIVDLDNLDKPYEAISYQWGSPKISKSPLLISGKQVYVSATLTNILMGLRLRDRVRILWADAICINQGDHDERQQQVRLMRRVYSQASRVVICLGSRMAAARDCFAAVEKLTSIWLDFQNGDEATLKEGQKILDTKYRSKVDEITMERVLQIFQDSYWTRLWVVQEVVQSRLAVVHWDGEEISWTLVGLTAVLIRNQGTLWQKFTSTEASQLAVCGLLNAYLMYRLPSATFRGNSMSFLDILRLTRRFNVTVLLDRIYAVLGLPSKQTDSGRAFISPNYRILREGLYTRAFYWITATHDTPLEILSAVRHKKHLFDGFPTWIPQWHVEPIRSIAGSHHKAMKFNASANCPPNPLFRVNWKLGERSLSLEGIVLGTIISSARTLPASLPLAVKHPKRRARLLAKHNNQLEEWASRHVEGESGRLAFSLTLTAGQDWYGSIVREPSGQDRHLKDFFSWMRLQNWSIWPHCGAYGDQSIEGAQRYTQAIRNVGQGRKIFATTRFGIGLGPDVLRDGDVVCLLFGGPVPYVLRPLRGSMYHFVGECYIPGHMFGEAVERWRAGTLGSQKPDQFVLK